MQCDTCGSMLESIDDTQIIDGGRFYKSKLFCERHKPIQEIYSWSGYTIFFLKQYDNKKFLNEKKFLLIHRNEILKIIKEKPIIPNSPRNCMKSEWAWTAYIVEEFSKLILNKYSNPPVP